MSNSKEALFITQYSYQYPDLPKNLSGFPTNGLASLVRELTMGSIPHLGAQQVCGQLVERGYQVRVADLYQDINNLPPQQDVLVLLSMMDIGVDRGKKIITELDRQGNRNILVGGVGASALQENLMQEFPWIAVVNGYAEGVLSLALDDHEKGRLAGQVYRRETTFDLSDNKLEPYLNPEYRRALDHLFRPRHLFVAEASRGCGYACPVCVSAKEPVTVKPLGDLMTEIEKNRKEGQILFFVDQNLNNCSPEYLIELFSWINKQPGVFWIGEGTIAPLLETEEGTSAIQIMSKRCLTYLVGVEDIGHRYPGSSVKSKFADPAYLENFSKEMRALKMPILYSLIMGLDTHESGYMLEAAREIMRLGITPAAHLATPRPGTPFWDKVLREKRMVDDRSAARNMRMNFVHNTPKMTRGQVLEEFGEFQKIVYSPREIWQRYYHNYKDCGVQYASGLVISDLVYLTNTQVYLGLHREVNC